MSDSSTSGPGNGEHRDPEQPDANQPGSEQPGEQDQYGQGRQHGQGQYWQQPHGQQPYGYPQGGYEGYQQPGGYYGGYSPPAEHPQATMALVLGLVGLIGTILCFGVPSIVGPFAWYVGAKAKKEIEASSGQLGGHAQAVTGYVLGIITTVFLVLIILVIGALIAIAVAGGFDDAVTT